MSIDVLNKYFSKSTKMHLSALKTQDNISPKLVSQ